MKLKKINDHEYEIEKEGDMNVPVKIFSSEKLMENLKGDKSLQQAINVSKLPGIYKASCMCPDAHQGYGFSIGGVAAFDIKKGLITPGGIGFDINCGVRLLTTNLTKEQVEPKIKELLEVLFKRVPSGVGSESKIRLTDAQLDSVLKNGGQWVLDNGYGTKDDVELAEENSRMPEADPSKVSQKAKSRGRKQLGTLGAGNHFLEIQIVDEIFDEAIAKEFGIIKKDQIVIMIHCGSRGLGHQVCSDYLRRMEEENPELADSLPERDLVYAPAGTELAEDYFKAMSAAANYAWANRTVIAHEVREGFKQVFGDVEVLPVYDVAHNIAKKEKHIIDGEEKEVYLHRKGATRSFPPGHPDLPEKYKKTGQPVLIPGSMGTSSYILVGTQKAMEESFGSTAHGAGRAMSRHATRQFRAEDIKKELEEKHIYVKSASWKGIAEECPQAYKDIDEVIKVSHEAGIGKLVAKVRPLGVIKG